MSRRKYTNLMIVTSIKQLISSRVSRPAPELVAETEQFLALWRDPEEIEPAEGLLLSREKLYAIRASYKRSGAPTWTATKMTETPQPCTQSS